MTRPQRAVAVAAGLLIVAIVLSSITGAGATSGAPSYAARTRPVEASRLVCPHLVTRTSGHVAISTIVGAATPVAHDAGPGTVSLRRASVPLRRAATTILRSGGHAWLRYASGDEGAVALTATGSRIAPGFVADQVTRRDNGAYRGLDSTACTPTTGSAWAIGGATTVGIHTLLYLTNVDPGPAAADINLFGPRGQVSDPNGHGIVVQAHSTEVVDVSTLAPNVSRLLIHVIVRAGHLAVAVNRQDQRAATARGVDFLPLVTGPARSSVVPGIVGGSGDRVLYLGNPGPLDASAQVGLVERHATFVPKGLAHVDVPAGTVIAVALTHPLTGGPAAAVITADRPLVAGAEMITSPGVGGVEETAWTAAAPPLTGTTAVVANDVTHRNAYLFLSAPKGAAKVRVTRMPGVGAGGGRSQTVAVSAGHTVAIDLHGLAGGGKYVAVALAVESGSGPVYAAREVYERGSRGSLFSVLPMIAAPQVVNRPYPVLDLRTGLRH
jgi:uncharacterized protein DUF5719